MGDALEFQLTADGTGFIRTLDGLQRKAAGFGPAIGSSITKALGGAFVFAHMQSMVAKVISAAGHIKDLAEQTDLTTTEVQKLDAAASNVGLSFQDFQNGLSLMGGARRDAIKDNERLLAFFNQYGISLKQLQDPQLRNIDLMKQLAESADLVNMSFKDRQGFKDVFGKSGDKLIAALQELKTMGKISIMEPADIAAMDQAAKDWGKLEKLSGKKLAPYIAFASRYASNAADPNRSFLRGDKTTAGELDSIFKIAGNYLNGDKASTAFGKNLQSAVKDAQTANARGSDSDKKIAMSNIDAVIANGVRRGMVSSLNPLFARVADLFPEMKPGYNASDEQFKREAKGFGMSTEEYQWASAIGGTSALNEKPAGKQAEEYKKWVERNEKLMERLRELRMGLLPPMEREAALQDEINTKLQEATSLEKNGDFAGGMTKREEAAQLNEQLARSGGSGFHLPAADSSTAAGGFIGAGALAPTYWSGGGNTESILRQVEKNTADIANKIGPAEPRIVKDEWSP